jgi:hypothetical protein
MFNHLVPNIELPKLVQINEEGVRYYVTPSGLKLPSVTTVLSKTDKNKNYALAKWRNKLGEKESTRITNNSAGRGKSLHTICEKYLNNDVDYKKDARYDSIEMFTSIKPFLNRIDNVQYQETRLFSERLGVAGTVDCIADFDNITSIVDFKNARAKRTEKQIHTYFLQATAYLLIYNELRGFPVAKQIVIIMAVEDDEPQIFIKKPNDYILPLLTAIEKYRRI